MSTIIDIKGYETKGIKIDPNGTEGEAIELHGLLVVLPKKPRKSEILFHDQPKKLQLWKRTPMPEEMRSHHTSLSKKTSLRTWLLVKLTLVVSVSFILSVVVLATLTYALLSWWMKLVKLKRSFLAYSRRQVKTRRRTFS